MSHPNAQFVCGDINFGEYSDIINSGWSIDESSLTTEADYSLSGGSYVPSINNTESLASNCAISGDDFSAQKQNSQEYQRGPMCKRQGEPLSYPAVTWPIKSMYQASVYPTMSVKKPRLDIRQDVSYSRQQQPHCQYFMQLSSCASDLDASLSMERNISPNQQHMMTSPLISPQRIHIQPPPSDQLLVDCQNAAMKGAGAIYTHRLMCYMQHQRQRPRDNNIDYWRIFVKEYYSPDAQRRWCLSRYKDDRSILSQAAKDTWRCTFCKSKPGKGLVATFEGLIRMKKRYFDSGVNDELLYFDVPYERRFPSGCVALIGKAIQESVYNDFRVVHEGQLCVIFTQELKIKSWEFCVHHHEEVISCRLLAPQVNELLVNITKLQSAVKKKGAPRKDLLTNCNRFAAASDKIARTVQQPLLNQFGFPPEVVRSMQLNEVFDCMKDLISYSLTKNLSPIESLKKYTSEVVNTKLNMRQTEGQPLYIPRAVSHLRSQPQTQQIPQVPDYGYKITSSSEYGVQRQRGALGPRPSPSPSSSQQDPAFCINGLLGIMRSAKPKGVSLFQSNVCLSPE